MQHLQDVAGTRITARKATLAQEATAAAHSLESAM
jgi:hypothetical protein